ncbi:MAG: hypothetical protein ACLSXO_00370 [Coprococcus sp.]
MLVIESGKTKYRLFKKKAKIENSGCPVLGAVLSSGSSQGGYYGKKYRQYYGHNE